MKKRSFLKRFFPFALCVALFCFMNLATYAAEPNIAQSTSILTTNDSDTVQPRGSLSGYGSQYLNGNYGGSFEFEVTGSWSPWAGCTVRFTGVPNGSYFTYNLTEISSGRSMFGDRGFTVTSGSQGDEGDHNIVLLNVSPGKYRLTWTSFDGVDGIIHCHIY